MNRFLKNLVLILFFPAWILFYKFFFLHVSFTYFASICSSSDLLFFLFSFFFSWTYSHLSISSHRVFFFLNFPAVAYYFRHFFFFGVRRTDISPFFIVFSFISIYPDFQSRSFFFFANFVHFIFLFFLRLIYSLFSYFLSFLSPAIVFYSPFLSFYQRIFFAFALSYFSSSSYSFP